MTILAQSIARAFPANSLQINLVRHLLLLALAGLFVALLRASYGLDLSWGFF
ncbi:response regulator [Bradyrhizobium jicamae]|uniref:Response regulator n=1 Tax=Bradyrhizobium jicamae TaxID=280332 RepID=A0ABS5FB61_9BRAD|nr:response regulator [Bradyrhizobium jicamae]MBR0794029.1 response regulator [Bradyrhizobium jicamae]MBR0932171.1 response regulator [Bradyrhizobium jicamae]